MEHASRKHSRIGASSSKRWFNCPASPKLSDGIVTQSSVYAEEGTCAHEMAEYCLEHELDACHGIGLEFNGVRATQEMAEAVQVYLDAIRERMGEDCELLVEEKFHLDWIHPDLFGSNDACIIDHKNKKLIVLDYKHGKGFAVDAVNNTQLMYYALGAIHGLEDFYFVDLIVVQPRAEGKAVKVWETDIERLDTFEEEIKQRIKAVETADASKDPSRFAKAGDHCKFCPATATCKALKQETYDTALVEFDDISEEPYVPAVETLTPEQIAKVLKSASVIENWIKEVKSYAKNQADVGIKVPGMKLVKARANRKWTDESKVVDELEMVLGDQMYSKKIISPAQAEKVLGKGKLDHLIETPDKGTQLVPESDKRQEINPSVIEDFTDI